MGQDSSKIEEGKVYLFPHSDFKGSPLVVDQPISLSKMGKKEDYLSSLILPSGFSAFLFRQSAFVNKAQHLRGPDRFSQLESSFDAIASAIIAQSISTPILVKNNQIALYFSGSKGIEGLLLEAPVNLQKISDLGIPNNALQKIQLGRDVCVSLYPQENYSGEKESISGPSSKDLLGRISSLQSQVQEKDPPELIHPVLHQLLASWGIWIAIFIILILLIWLYFSYQQ